jgi:aspartyl-tRNA(Asn)/glutamyl-tRNA(Gln) amidotransferase subunit A
MKTSVAPQRHPLHTLVDVSEAIRQRQLSPVEVVRTCLDRIERLQPRLNAFITVAVPAALQAARKK